MVRNRSVLDPVLETHLSHAKRELRTDGYYWKESEVARPGGKGKAVHALVFVPGGYLKILPVVPALYAHERDSLPDSLDTYDRAKAKMLSLISREVANTRSFSDWGWYVIETDQIRIGILDYEGIGIPFFNQTLAAYAKEGKVLSGTELDIAGSRYRFEPAAIRVDTSSLCLNRSRFRKKRFPAFFWGW
jgi:hypothetical protein